MEDSTPPETPSSTPSADRVLEWAKVAVIPVAIFLLGFLLTSWQKQRDDAENNVRLYTQLVSQREQSDSQLRTEMFKAVLEKFLSSPTIGNPQDMVLKLELLAYNFHESLDLGPLFKDVSRNLAEPSSLSQEKRQALRERLDRAAFKVTYQQVSALSLNGYHWSIPVNVEEVHKAADDAYVMDENIPAEPLSGLARSRSPDDGTRQPPGTLRQLRVRLQVLSMNVAAREVEVRLLVEFAAGGSPVVDRSFHVTIYDFPMLDNTRLPNSNRCAVVLTDFAVAKQGSDEEKRRDSFAMLDVVVFPATSASMKERIEYDELLAAMLRSKRASEVKGVAPAGAPAPR